jgi:hypothetical protein
MSESPVATCRLQVLKRPQLEGGSASDIGDIYVVLRHDLELFSHAAGTVIAK